MLICQSVKWRWQRLYKPPGPESISRAWRSDCRRRNQRRPETVSALLRDELAEFLGPIAVVAVIAAPLPKRLGQALQLVFLGEAHRAVHLVGHAGHGADGDIRAQLGGRDLEMRRTAVARATGGCSRHARRRHFFGEYCKLLLDCLKRRERLAELLPLARVLNGELERR